MYRFRTSPRYCDLRFGRMGCFNGQVFVDLTRIS